MSPDPKELARFARVEPPAELDAWVRRRMSAAVAEQAQAVSLGARTTGSTRDERASGSRPRSNAMPARTAAPVPLLERIALASGAVVCAIQASAFVLRMVWSALTLGR